MLAIASFVAAVAASVYWYMNRHKPIKHIVYEAKSVLDINGAGAGGLLDDWLNHWRNKIVLPDAKNKVIVVTGGARGIGKEIVKQLLQANSTVIIGIRNPEHAKQLQSMENSHNLHTYALDLQSLGSIKNFAESVIKEHPMINILVNNAGIMYGDYKLTKDGFESQMGVNHLGHFYLTHLMLPVLKKSGQLGEMARVVSVSSCAHFPGTINFEDINSKEHYDDIFAYMQSKLAQVMSTRYINQMMEDEGYSVRCFSVHPGIVNTDIFDGTMFKKFLPWLMKLLFKSPSRGATSVLYGCFNKELEKKGGLYISNCTEGFSNSFSKNKDHQRRLYQLSCQLVGLDTNQFGR